MKTILSLLLIFLVSFSGCANKKRKALLFPFVAILDSGETTTPNTFSSPSTTSETGGSGNQVIPPAPDKLASSESTQFQVTPTQSSNEYAVVPVEATNTTTSTEVSSSKGDSESSSSVSNDITNLTDTASSSKGDSGSSSSVSSDTTNLTDTVSSVSNSVAEVLPSAGVVVAESTKPFTFQTTTIIPVSMTVVDSTQTPISNAVVNIYEVNSNNGETNLLFQQLTNSSGYVEGSIVVKQSTTQLEAAVSINNESSKPVPIPLEVAVTKDNGEVKNYPISAITSLTIPTQVKPQVLVADRDGDGVPDSLDFYPDDPSKSSKIRIPSSGVNTVSFEDLFPSAGDADLNDYVVQFYNEEDLNSKGEVVEIRGEYQHVAKGAGYKHTLNLRLPLEFTVCRGDKDKGHGNETTGIDTDNPGKSTGVNQNALEKRKATFTSKCDREEKISLDVTFESIIYDGSGIDTKTGKVRYTPSLEEMKDGFEILGDSSKTISSANVDPTKPYKPGHRAVVKIVFNKPIPKAQLGNAPYDLFIRILSKKLDSKYPKPAPKAENPAKQFYEVHFPGIYFDNGKDIYLDNSGFPWAVLIPSTWAWPLEGKTYDIRGNKSAYPKFKIWMESKGQLEKDWYLYPDKNHAYPLPEISSSLTAFLKQIDSVSLGVAFLILLGGLGVLILRKKFLTV